MIDSNEKDLLGSFSELPFSELMSWLGNKQNYGILQLKNGAVRKEFRYREGRPYFFRSSLEYEQLEYILAKLDIAELEQLKRLRSEALREKKPTVTIWFSSS